MTDFHNIEMNDIKGERVSLSDFQGKLCLIVNLASR